MGKEATWTLTRCGRPDIPGYQKWIDDLIKRSGTVMKPAKGEALVIISLGPLDEPSVLDVDLEEEAGDL